MFVLLLFIVLFITLFLSFFEREGTIKYKWTYMIIVIVLCALAAFRPQDVDKDYLTYVDYFTYSDNNPIDVEPSFEIIVKAIKVFTSDSRWLFIVYAIITIPLFTYILNKISTTPHLSLAVWISNFYIIHGLTQIRVGVSTAFFLMGLSFLIRKKNRLYLLVCILCAIFFHYSAIFYLLLLFISNKEVSKKELLCWAAIPIVPFALSLGGIDILNLIPNGYIRERVQLYNSVSNNGVERVNYFNIPYLLHLLVYYFLLIKYKLITTRIKYLPLIIRVYGISVFFYIAFSFLPVLAFRTSELFGIIEILMLPAIIHGVRPNRVGVLLVAVITIAMMIINILYNKFIVL